MKTEMIQIPQVRVADKFWDRLITNATDFFLLYIWLVLSFIWLGGLSCYGIFIF